MSPHRIKILKKMNHNRRGIALVVALGTMIFIFIVSALGVYLVTRSLNVAGGQKRYQSTFEACEGGLEIGLAKVDSAFTLGVEPSDFSGGVGRYELAVTTEPLFRTTVAGAALKYARGYEGVGMSISRGGVTVYYHILAEASARGMSGEQVALEIKQKKIIGID